MRIILWILSKIYPVYWEVTLLYCDFKAICHFLTENEAIDYCQKQSCDCVIDKYINCRPICLIQDNRVHRLIAYKEI